MTASSANIGYGSTFAIGDGGSPETFTTVAEVVNLKGLKYKKDQPEATHLASPNGFKEFIDGLKDFDAIAGAFNYVPGGSAETALLAAFNASTRHNYKIVFPNGTAWVFPGVMTEFAPGDLDPAKKMEAAFTIKPASSAAIVPPGPPTLVDLALSSSTFSTSAAAGTAIGTIQNETFGSTVAVNPPDARVAISGGNLVVGSTPSSTGTFSITLRETDAGATNSPHDTVITLTVTAGGGGSGTQLSGSDGQDLTGSDGQLITN